MPDKIQIMSISDFSSTKTGKHYYLATAEIPAIVPGGWSTVRLRAISEHAFTCKAGAVIPLRLLSFDARKGEGTFQV